MGGVAAPPIEWDKEYLTFKALDSCQFTHTLFDIDYSLDGGKTWVSLSAGTASPVVAAGSLIKFKGTIASGNNGSGTFSSTGRYEAMGNPISLIYGDNFVGVTDLSGKTAPFKRMFYNSSNLASSKNLVLVAEKVTTNAYSEMFYGCSAMTNTVGIIEATTLGQQCCDGMYGNCTSLSKAPELPATTLANYCYRNMFTGCTGLTTIQSVLPADTLSQYCYYGMYTGCIGVTTAPVLPATTLASNCYRQMFDGCRNLAYVKAMFTTTPGSSYTLLWLRNVKSSGTFVKSSSATWEVSGNDGIPSGWTIIYE